MSDPDTAAEVIQEALTDALSSARTFARDGEVVAWLHQSVTRAALDRVLQRAHPRHRAQGVSEADAVADGSGRDDEEAVLRKVLAGQDEPARDRETPMVQYRLLISAAGLGGEQPSTDGAVDLALLKAHCSGDPDAFTELVRRHRDRLWRAALVLLRDREDAADAVQDALIRAFRSASTFRAEAQIATWLHSIVIRVCMDRIATRRRRATCPLTEERTPPRGWRTPGTPSSMSW